MKNIIIGQYLPGNSFLYKIDPRAKILSLMILMISVFMLSKISHVFIGLIIVLLILICGRISVRRIYRGLKPLLFLLMFTLTFQVLFNKSGDILISKLLSITSLNIILMVFVFLIWFFVRRYIKTRFLWFLLFIAALIYIQIGFTQGNILTTYTIKIYEDGLIMAGFIILRLIIIVILSTMLTLTTKPTDLNLGLESILKPLKLIKINSEEIALIISITLRFIPTLLDEANKIILAQASRGVDFNEGKLKDKIVQIISLLVPMFIISFKRSEDLADAMEARCFVPGKKRSRINILSWRIIDTSVMIFVSSVLCVVLFII